MGSLMNQKVPHLVLPHLHPPPQFPPLIILKADPQEDTSDEHNHGNDAQGPLFHGKESTHAGSSCHVEDGNDHHEGDETARILHVRELFDLVMEVEEHLVEQALGGVQRVINAVPAVRHEFACPSLVFEDQLTLVRSRNVVDPLLQIIVKATVALSQLLSVLDVMISWFTHFLFLAFFFFLFSFYYYFFLFNCYILNFLVVNIFVRRGFILELFLALFL